MVAAATILGENSRPTTCTNWCGCGFWVRIPTDIFGKGDLMALVRMLVLTAVALSSDFASCTWLFAQDRSAAPADIAPISEEEVAAGFRVLFDGKTLNGWKGNQAVFRVEQGAIIGGSLSQALPNNEFLRSAEQYGDFELRLQFKLVGENANAGIQIRTAEIPDHHEVIGYQADMGDGWWGCLYDESRRNRVLAGPPADQRDKNVRAGEWNDYRILCEGARIQLWINDVQTVDYTEEDNGIARRGIIALQIHSGPAAEASYRHIRLREIR
jgi:hypothetical protein